MIESEVMESEPAGKPGMAIAFTVIGAILFTVALSTLRQLAPWQLFALFATSAGLGGVGLKLLLTQFIARYGSTHVSTALGVSVLAGIVILFLAYMLFNAE